MLEIKPVCENCGKKLPNGNPDAMICTFECTFCKECVDNLLFNVCPNCGGGFEKRPARPKHLLEKYPVSTTPYFKPVDRNKFALTLEKYKNVPADER